MPTPSIGPNPAERMTELLARSRARGEPFDDAWQSAWDIMVAERAWPHRTLPRRQWRAALRSSRPEFQAAYYGVETPYSRLHVDLTRITDASRFATTDYVLAELVA